VHKKFSKIAVWFRRYPVEQTDRQTDRRTNRNTSQPLLRAKYSMRKHLGLSLISRLTGSRCFTTGRPCDVATHPHQCPTGPLCSAEAKSSRDIFERRTRAVIAKQDDDGIVQTNTESPAVYCSSVRPGNDYSYRGGSDGPTNRGLDQPFRDTKSQGS